MTRTTIARGVYEDQFGFEVRWRDRGLTRSKRFPLDTPLDTLTAYRRTKQRLATSKREKVGSFVRDAVRWLRRFRSRTSYRTYYRAHLKPWLTRFPRHSRFTITRDAIDRALTDWDAAGYSPQELRHRLKLLRQLFRDLDTEYDPTQGVRLPRQVAKARPRSVSDTLVRDVALNLRKAEILHRLHNAKTRARYLVLATTGQRPTQLKRATPESVDLERRIWFVDPAKGDAGSIVYLNDDMLAAWRLFSQANAWGQYDNRSFVRTLQRNGWPKTIRPYNLRHTVGLTLSELGVDLGDIQHHMGHVSPSTTRIYVPGVLGRLREASTKLDGRLTPDHTRLPPPQISDTNPPKQKAKDGEKRPQKEGRQNPLKTGLRVVNTSKTA